MFLEALKRLIPASRDNLAAYFHSTNTHERSVISLLIRNERRAWGVAYLAILAAIVVGVALLYNIRFKAAPQPIVMTVDQKGVVDRVEALKDFDSTARARATNYFIWEWVKCRQGYSRETYLIQFKTCKYFAAPGAARDEFVKDFGNENPDGVYLRHGGNEGTGYSRLEFIYMQPTPLANKDAATKMMSVHYRLKEKGLGDTESKETRMVATVEYAFSELPQGEEGRQVNPFGLQIVRHHVDKEDMK